MADETVEVWRIYTKDDGTSAMEAIQIPMEPQRSGSVSALLAGPGMQFRRIPHDIKPEWHTGPRRQIIGTIKGEGELETGDGQKLIVKPGVITLIEDLTGAGHITRGRGTEDRICFFVHVNEDTKLY
jgi:hypothetical protein